MTPVTLVAALAENDQLILMSSAVNLYKNDVVESNQPVCQTDGYPK